MASHRTTTAIPLLSRPLIRPQRRTIATAAQAAAQLQESLAARPLVQRQTLDANQLHKLLLTLNRPSSQSPPAPGSPLPPGYHLVYFTPSLAEPALGPDGTDRPFPLPHPFTRRMWAGGALRWTRGVPLRVGEEVEERTRLVSAVPKANKRGDEMVIVEVDKEFWGPSGLAVVDRRSWVFRPPPKSMGLEVGEERAVRLEAGKCSRMEDVRVEGSGESLFIFDLYGGRWRRVCVCVHIKADFFLLRVCAT